MKQSMGAKVFAIPTPAPVWVIGSYDQAGKANIATVAWCGICCSKPPCVCISLRAATYTHGNLMQRKALTVNIPSEEQAIVADYVGISVYTGAKVDKFASTGLTPTASQMVDAPYVEEFPVVLACKIVAVHELGLHTQFIGEILDVQVEENVLDEEGKPDIEKVQPLLFAPSTNGYHRLGSYLGDGFELGKNAF